MQEANGVWLDETGAATFEYTIVCYLDGAEPADVYAAADEIRDALNQNTVLIERSRIRMEYYGGAG